MPFRIRRSIRILPGIRWNIGKRGGSVSIGGHGVTVNLSKLGTRTTLSAPGTGISYSSTLHYHQKTLPLDLEEGFTTHANAPGAAHVAPAPQVSPTPVPPSLAGAFGRLLAFAFIVALTGRGFAGWCCTDGEETKAESGTHRR